MSWSLRVDSFLKRPPVTVLFILLIFSFRLGFGICSEFWFEDEIQVYLIGLKFFTTAHLPLYGPDVVYTSSQIPGSLLGLLVGLPFYLWPSPIAPYVLLNLLSTAALLLLAYYIRRRIPDLPAWFTYLWVLSCPWVMNYSTHVVNPSYVLPAAVVFFIAFLESWDRISTGFINKKFCFLLMGVALLWVFQLHLSWVLMLPFIIFSIAVNLKFGFRKNLVYILLFFAGAVLGGLSLLPVLLKEGNILMSGGTGGNVVLNVKNLGQIITVFTRYLSLASFELPRFIGANTAERLAFLERHIWAVPFIVYATFMGFAQPLWMIAAPFWKNKPKGFKIILLITGVAFIIVWLSFLFSVKGPASHTFYIMFPLIMIYSFYCYKIIFHKKFVLWLAAALILSGFIFHIALMQDNYRRKSMFRDYQKVSGAIKMKDDAALGERRLFDRNH